MIRVLLLLLSAGASVLLTQVEARAGCTFVEQVVLVQGVATVQVHEVCDADQTSASAATGHSGPLPPRDSDLDAVCVRAALSTGLDPFEFCEPPSTEPAATAPQLTPGMVASAFQRIPLPAAELQVQPPNGRTLVNFATNFYTEQGDLTRTVTLLGRQVELRIHPTRYTWAFGDGTTTTTDQPGAPYPNLQVTHDYRTAGQVAPSVDTTYSAEFSVDGGPWQPVDGTVTIPGEAIGLRVLTATPTLVGYR
ncbi:hypothetical protein GGQ22_19320 [Nocardioides sp. zg-579]|uniref:Uncharacterized protein n=1 Tax=Nocardioides marmotae TaxID=2663857 RepID=A0A6I3JGZ9_9ACTN|nr:hypothetical protein [Nocardioides marmotae]MCR6033565.1 hypothetical protein [Gordonia jinghuaiqii]MTB97223.1 hypothetical protein [Nocardioides marmotae]QKE02138.1 hypothetical protein HPC71_14440 [Nocardioides marmotae]